MAEVDHQLARWAAQKEQRLQLGDLLDQPRELDHTLLFRKKTDGNAAAQTLEAASFRVTVSHGFLRTVVHASRSDALTDENIARVLGEVVGVAGANNGRYDGFGGTVIQNPTSS